MMASVVMTYTPDTWIDIIHLINHHVRQLKILLHASSIDLKQMYMMEWNSIYAEIMDIYQNDHNTQFETITTLFFGNPETLQDMATEAICMVPPLSPILKVKKATNWKNTNIAITKVNNEIISKQLELHHQYQQPPQTNPTPTELNIEEPDPLGLHSASSEGIDSEIQDK